MNNNFTGKNVKNISLVKQSDIFPKIDHRVMGNVIVPALNAGEVLEMGTLLRSDDGGLNWNPLLAPIYVAGSFSTDDEVYANGHIYKSSTDANTDAVGTANWEDLGEWNPNGILGAHLTQSEKTTVVVMGSAKAKHLIALDDQLRAQLFNNKLFIK